MAACIGLAIISSGHLANAQNDRPLTPSELEFFESKIRPALIDYCFDCHSGEGNVKGNLQLDSKKGARLGGSSGPAVVPGDPGKSLMIKAISWADPNLQMPPGGKLPANIIADLQNWVQMGAPDPRVGKKAVVLKSDQDLAKAREHWAFKPVTEQIIPKPKSHLTRWVKNDIDLFILTKMEEKQLLPSPEADRWTLIRRAYFDLIGMPPTMEEVEAFMTDKAPDAWEKVIDTLLASEHYGERWGRYWLDVARYADTRGGNLNRGMRNRMVHAWTYRDWVVKSINDDKPYDQFLREQIAADLIHGTQKEDLAALGFLSISRGWNNQQELIDDQIDVLTRGTMCLSVYCARCHDHKFDPVSQKDYYGLYGVFDSIQLVNENKPLIENPQLNPEYTNYLYRVARLKYDREQFKRDKVNDYLGEAKSNTVAYMMVSHYMNTTTNYPLSGRAATDRFEENTKLEAEVAQSWNRFMKDRTKKDGDRVFQPWKDYLKIIKTKTVTNFVAVRQPLMIDDSGDGTGPAYDPKNFVNMGGQLYRRLVQKVESIEYNDSRALSKKYWNDGKPVSNKINPNVARLFSTPLKSMQTVAERYARLFQDAENHWAKAVAKDYKERVAKKDASIASITKLEDKDWEEIRQVYYARRSPVNVSYDQLARMDNRRIQNEENRTFTDAEERLEMTHPGAPGRAMAVADLAKPREPVIFIKGNARDRGEAVKRKFIDVLDPGGKPFSERGSGRLDLAFKIGSKRNPLTARVMINRAWMHHFGAPIVGTPTDFGVRAADPTHPEMMDYLAKWFMDNKWSLKKLHKLIMTSATYRQGSDINPKSMLVDSANQNFWRMNRRRLDFEGFRDSLLHVSGQIDPTVGGKPVDLMQAPYTMKRTVYGYIDRQNLGTIFQTFDFANPLSTTGQRFNSTVPQQALFMMNSGFIAELARGIVMREEVQTKIDEPQKIEKLYELTFQRKPTPLETKIGIRFLEKQHDLEKTLKPKAIWTYGFGQYDPRTRKLLRFTPLPHYSVGDGAYQGGERYPDQRFGYARLTADGGFPGPNSGVSVIRRWTAPQSGTFSIDGILEHGSRSGDGVAGFIVFKEQFEIGRFVAFGNRYATKVPKLKVAIGDTVDFVIDPRGTPVGDGFAWSASMRLLDAGMPFLPSAKDLGGSVVKANAGQAAVNNMNYNARMGMNNGQQIQGPKSVWSSGEDFYLEQEGSATKSLSTWEKYAQVLLLSNEIMYVD